MENKRYRYFLFDLDRTLWDFDQNSKNTLFLLLDKFGQAQIEKENFLKKFNRLNRALWQQYERGEITKEQLREFRFYNTFKEFGVDNLELGAAFEHSYIADMSLQTNLMPHAREILDKLKEGGAKMAIISNGFVEAQYDKLKNSNLEGYFDEILISDQEGYKKPSPILFKRAITRLGAVKEETLMVGDDWINDIEGAMIYGIDQFFYNPTGKEAYGRATYHSTDLRELLPLGLNHK